METNSNSMDLLLAKEQRDQALACAFLAFIIALALVISNIGPDHKTESALAVVQQHKKILAQHQSILRENQAELEQNLTALKNVEGKK